MLVMFAPFLPMITPVLALGISSLKRRASPLGAATPSRDHKQTRTTQYYTVTHNLQQNTHTAGSKTAHMPRGVRADEETVFQQPEPPLATPSPSSNRLCAVSTSDSPASAECAAMSLSIESFFSSLSRPRFFDESCATAAARG